MNNIERVLAAIARVPGPVCEDCLSQRAEVSPRQQVFKICSNLAARHTIDRCQMPCGLLRQVEKGKPAASHGAGGLGHRTRQVPDRP